jgi:hypothetical protein
MHYLPFSHAMNNLIFVVPGAQSWCQLSHNSQEIIQNWLTSSKRVHHSAWDHELEWSSIFPQGTRKKAVAITKQIERIVILEQLRWCHEGLGNVGNELLNKKIDDHRSTSLYKSISIPPEGASSKGISNIDTHPDTSDGYKILSYGTDWIKWQSRCRWCLRLVSQWLLSFPFSRSIKFWPVPRLIWILTFAPLAFVRYKIIDSETLQMSILALQCNLFPAYCKCMLQHDAGHLMTNWGIILGLDIPKYIG